MKMTQSWIWLKMKVMKLIKVTHMMKNMKFIPFMLQQRICKTLNWEGFLTPYVFLQPSYLSPFYPFLPITAVLSSLHCLKRTHLLSVFRICCSLNFSFSLCLSPFWYLYPSQNFNIVWNQNRLKWRFVKCIRFNSRQSWIWFKWDWWKWSTKCKTIWTKNFNIAWNQNPVKWWRWKCKRFKSCQEWIWFK
jgi:hypothetical protein